jgi:hypothetical protein
VVIKIVGDKMEDIIKKLKIRIDMSIQECDYPFFDSWICKQCVLISRWDAKRIVEALEGSDKTYKAGKDLRHLTNDQLIMLALSKLLKQTKSGTGSALIAELDDRFVR